MSMLTINALKYTPVYKRWTNDDAIYSDIPELNGAVCAAKLRDKFHWYHVDGLVQEWRSSSTLAMELRLFFAPSHRYATLNWSPGKYY